MEYQPCRSCRSLWRGWTGPLHIDDDDVGRALAACIHLAGTARPARMWACRGVLGHDADDVWIHAVLVRGSRLAAVPDLEALVSATAVDFMPTWDRLPPGRPRDGPSRSLSGA